MTMDSIAITDDAEVLLLQTLHPPCLDLIRSLEAHALSSFAQSTANGVERSLSSLLKALQLIQINERGARLFRHLRLIMMPLMSVATPSSKVLVPTLGMRELAFDCIATVIAICGQAFAQGMDHEALKALQFSLVKVLAEASGMAPGQSHVPVVSKTPSGAEEGFHLAATRCLVALFNARHSKREPVEGASSATCEEQWLALQQILETAGDGGMLALLLSALLHSAEKGAGELRTVAVEAIAALMRNTIETKVWNKFLPGVFSGLYRVIRRGGSVGHRSTQEVALRALVMLLTVTLGGSAHSSTAGTDTRAHSSIDDLILEWGTSHVAPANEQKESVSPGNEHLSHIMHLLPPLLTFCRSHSSWRLRVAAANAAGDLLYLCSSHDTAEVGGTFTSGRDVAPGADAGIEALIVPLLQCIIALLWDDVKEVKEAAEEGLTRYRESLSPHQWLDVRSLLMNDVTSVADALPALAASQASETHLLAQLKLLRGYLMVLGTGADRGGGREHVFRRLSQVLQFDNEAQQKSSHTGLLDGIGETAPTDVNMQLEGIESTQIHSFPRKHFLHCRDVSTAAAARDLVRHLGRLGTSPSKSDTHDSSAGVWWLVSSLGEALAVQHPGATASRQHQMKWLATVMPVVYCSAEWLWGAVDAIQDETKGRHIPEAAALQAFHIILRSDAWNLPTSPIAQDDTSQYDETMANTTFAYNEDVMSTTVVVPSLVLATNAMLSGLLLEVLAAVACAAGPSVSEALLLRCAYPVLDKLADPHPTPRAAALATLHHLQVLTQHDSIRSLLAANMDYLVEDVVSRLRSGGDGMRRAHAVVTKLLSHLHTTAITPLMRDLSRAVVKGIDSSWWEPAAAEPSLEVLRAIAGAIDVSEVADKMKAKDKASSSEKGSNTEDTPEDTTNDAPSLAAAFKSSPWFKQLLSEACPSPPPKFEDIESAAAENGADGDANVTTNERETGANDDIATDSAEVKLLLEILDRCQYFASTQRLKAQSVAVQCVSECLTKLAATGSERALLPAVHKSWPSLMSRFREHTSATKNTSNTDRRSIQTSDIIDRRGAAREGIGLSSTSRSLTVLLSVTSAVEAIAALCGDFLSMKVPEELWPQLRKLLDVLLPVAVKEGGGSIRNYTVAAKVSSSILQLLSSLCAQPTCRRFMQPLAKDIATKSLPALSAQAPPSIREAGKSLFVHLSDLHGDMIWALLTPLSLSAGGTATASPLPFLLAGLARPAPASRESSRSKDVAAGVYGESAKYILEELSRMPER